ncbi:MAG: hypothetical protein P8N76_05670 [Pirellulaceae bacterium]|nr:hypothetical protein [Pirellulaceae bacterium]
MIRDIGLAVVLLSWTVGAASAETLIENQSIRVCSVKHGNSVGLRFEVLDGARWRTVLSNLAIAKKAPWEKAQQTHLESLDIETIDGGNPQSNAAVFTAIKKVSHDHVILMGSHGDRAIQMSVQLTGPDQVSVRVSASARRGGGEVQLSHMWSHYYFVPDDRAMGYALPLDFAWLPNLHKNAEDVCGDHFFRSPAVITQGRGLYAAMVPDLDVMRRNRIVPHSLDLRDFEHPAAHPYGVPRLSYGLCPWTAKPHVFTAKGDPVAVKNDQKLEFEYDLFLGSAVDSSEIVGRVTNYLWNEYGHRYFGEAGPQVLPFEEYGKRYAYKHELVRWATKTVLPTGDGYGINNEFRRGANYHAWENDMHMGFGIWHYGQAWQEERLKQIGRGILNLNLSAPQLSGAFPCVFNFESHQWEGSLYWTSWPAHPTQGFDSQAMGVTAWWRLYWAENFAAFASHKERIAASVIRYANFLSSKQLDSGAIPTYYDENGDAVPQLRESATTAISGAVLAKAAMLSQSDSLKKAAVKAGEYMAREILPTTRFQDFEVFYSCSPKALHWVDPVNGIPPINNLAVQWAADQFLALYQLTSDERWLKHGEYSLGILSLFQQVWDPPFYNVHLYGGFGVMNTDGEWNDGRQSRFVPTYADYYLATGKTEYLERAVAACRSSFALMDMAENHRNRINGIVRPEGAGLGFSSENIFHNGPQDARGGWTGYNWGPGGGLGASAYLDRKFGTVYLDGRMNKAVPIDGVKAEVVRWTGDQVELSVKSALADLPYPYREKRLIRVKFRDVQAATLKINGRDLGPLSSDGETGTINYELE